jgi:putative DNA primase/helicase
MSNDRKQAVIDSGIFTGVVRELFPKMQVTGTDQALVNCPFHQDEAPSLSVKLSEGLFHCFACGAKGNGFDLYMKVVGCDFKSALQYMENRAGINPGTGFSETSNVAKIKPRKVATFNYTDEHGKRLYIKERWEPARDGKRTKEFFFNHFDKQGKKQLGYKGPHVLYRLHEIVKADQVFILEGEMKADLLASWGLVATCLDTGAESKWKDAYTPFLADKDVVIVPDNDKAGEEYLHTIAKALYGVAKSVKVLRLPGLPEKGDVIDWITLQGNVV